MNSFRYYRDGLFLTGCLLYAVNRWGVKPYVHRGFFHDHFNDLLLIPCALPVLLWLQRRLRLRTHDRMPAPGEIALYLAVWSILFEVVGPHLLKRATGDPCDVIAYVVGGILAGIWWHRDKIIGLHSRHEF